MKPSGTERAHGHTMMELLVATVVVGVLGGSILSGHADHVAATSRARFELVAHEAAMARLAALRSGLVPRTSGPFEVEPGLLPSARGMVRVEALETGLVSVRVVVSWGEGGGARREAAVESWIAEER